MPAAPPSFDIFCRVVDNYGDIGVCWRLARQLARLNAPVPVRLWVDDMQAFARIEPAVDAKQDMQTVRDVEIIHWSRDLPELAPHDVVIEAFACELPPNFVSRMVERDSLCINLEYLSAEKWVEGCHAMPSLQANGLRKCFYFPGFTAATGGLLREPGLLETRDAWLSRPGERWRLLQTLGMPDSWIKGLQSGWRQAYLFCYRNAPARALVQAFNSRAEPSVLIVPEGVHPSLAGLAAGHVHVFETPFVSQEDFDRLLWSSDLNFVRGEDSLARAIWAGKPFVWQIYQQEDAAHLEKLRAWLDLAPFGRQAEPLMLAWNTGNAADTGTALQALLAHEAQAAWCRQTRQWCDELAAQTGLAESLVDFCAKNRGKE